MSLEPLMRGVMKLLLEGRKPKSITDRAFVVGVAVYGYACWAKWPLAVLFLTLFALVVFALLMVTLHWLENRLLEADNREFRASESLQS